MWLVDILWALAVLLGVRSLAGRLLAAPIGPIATIVSASLGIAAGVGLQRALTEASGNDPDAYATFAAVSVLTTMAVVAAMGLLARPADCEPLATVAAIPHPVRAARTRLARTRRYLSLLWLGARYGLGPLSGLRRVRRAQHIGVALRDALQEAGGIFIKFGQLLSARTDLVPAAIALELSSLHDEVKPLPAQTELDVVCAELGRPVDQLFAHFDETPLAAASIAQAHRVASSARSSTWASSTPTRTQQDRAPVSPARRPSLWRRSPTPAQGGREPCPLG